MNASPSLTPERIIELLNLEPLPVEGGYYRRSYLATETVAAAALPERYRQAKSLSSVIYYLLHGTEFSALHRLLSDEIYHFYLGDPVELLLLMPDGTSQVVRLGPDLEAGEAVQALAPRGSWQGSRVVPGGSWALLGTSMAPAWDESDFELGQRDELCRLYPDRAELIRQLTHV